MSRSGPRPHVWKVQGEIPHAQYLAWLQMKAQANFRGEAWHLPFEDYQAIWQEHWHLKGRGKEHYCLTRQDPQGAWDKINAVCILRIEHLRTSQQRKKEMRANGKYTRRQPAV